MQPDLYRESVLRMLRAVNTLDSNIATSQWDADHEKLADSLNVLREQLQEFRALLTDLDQPESLAGQFDQKLRELDLHLQGANVALNQLRSQAFDLQIGLDPRLTSHLGVALGELAEQMQKDYETILLDPRDRDPSLFLMHDTGLDALLQAPTPDPGIDQDLSW